MNEQPQLVQIATGKRFFVSKEMIVGRQEGCDLRLAEGKASRRHAKVGPSDDGLWVEDLGSANGTFVNNVRVQTRMQLRSGDRLRFDIEEFDVHLPAAARLPSEAKTALRSEEPQAIRVAGSAAENKPPGAWADPDAAKGGKTQFITEEELRGMLSSAAPGSTELEIEDPHLRILSGTLAKTIIRLIVSDTGGNEWTIGSQDDRDIRFADPGVSAVHAKLVCEDGRWRLHDQISANGTFVNNKRSRVSVLCSSDRLRFGPVECEFRTAQVSSKSLRQPRDLAKHSMGKGWRLTLGVFLVTIVLLFLVWWLLG